jgi:hypothetical protein
MGKIKPFGTDFGIWEIKNPAFKMGFLFFLGEVSQY